MKLKDIVKGSVLTLGLPLMIAGCSGPSKYYIEALNHSHKMLNPGNQMRGETHIGSFNILTDSEKGVEIFVAYYCQDEFLPEQSYAFSVPSEKLDIDDSDIFENTFQVFRMLPKNTDAVDSMHVYVKVPEKNEVPFSFGMPINEDVIDWYGRDKLFFNDRVRVKFGMEEKDYQVQKGYGDIIKL